MTPGPGPNSLSPAPRWVRAWALATVALAFVLLALGGFVTSFRVGMADPKWPTAPTHIIQNYQPENFGLTVEHSHRFAGWTVGAAVIVLTLGVWWTEPNRRLRLYGLFAIVGLILLYGEFHRGMGETWSELKTLASVDPNAPELQKHVAEAGLLTRIKSWPLASGTFTLLFALTVVGIGVASGLSQAFGGWLRCCAMAALVAVMVQGLLGGFRVFLDAVAGANLAALHGAFGQVAFCVLVAVAVLAAPRVAGDFLTDDIRTEYEKMAWSLVFLLGIQLLLAVMLRHGGGALAQRLHILMAFVVAAALLVVVLRIRAVELPRDLVGGGAAMMAGLLVLQVLFGVEAYLGKFAAAGPNAQLAPNARPVDAMQAIIRTAHQLIGGLLLAQAVAVAIRVSREPVLVHYETIMREANVPEVAAMAFQQTEIDKVHESPAPDVAMMALHPPPDDEGLVIR